MSAYIIHNNFLSKAIFLFTLALFIIPFSQTACAEPTEEMQTILMYYNEEDLVITPTRFPKPISNVAENITVITAKDIDEMNAHTIAEVLERVPGLFVSFNRDFGATSLMIIQGSEQRHVRVQVDGVPWNLLSEGAAETNSIPTGIIQRIEVVKGPASSAWGSALGGIINIITKPAGTTKTPSGTLSMSYGETPGTTEPRHLAGPAPWDIIFTRDVRIQTDSAPLVILKTTASSRNSISPF
jgi:vitamin B12 transporter